MTTTAYDQSAATAKEAERCMLAAFAYLGIPSTMIDLGCGSGAMCRIAAALHCSSTGYDICLPRNYDRRDLHLRRQNFMDCKHDGREMVLCLEVAEHIPGILTDDLMDALQQATGEILLFSAATPEQGGVGHVNEQPHDYWREKLTNIGLVEDTAMTSNLRRAWSEVAPDAWWYGKNVMVWRRQQCKI